MSLPSTLRIPLIIGIIGHRRLDSPTIDRLETELRQYISRLRLAHPHTPFLIMSALGEGTDRIGARIGLKLEGVQLVSVLPWPPGVCDQHWHRSGDRDEFDQLLVRTKHRVYLPLPAGLPPERLADSEAHRQQRFAAVGRYIARHSQVLVAVWNGNENSTSQTASVIRWHLNGALDPEAILEGHLDEPETGLLVHIPVAGNHTTPPEADPGPPGPTKSPSPTQLKMFQEIVGSFEKFNADAARLSGGMSEALSLARNQVIPEAIGASLPPPVHSQLDRFALADQLSRHWQKQTLRWLFSILALIFLTVSAFEIYAHLQPDAWGWLLAYPGFFLTGIVLVRWAQSQRIFNRYLDYRALAEALRVNLFWKIAGLPADASDYYLRSYRSQLDWIRSALRAWTVESGLHGQPPWTVPDLRERIDLVRKHWLADQFRFFTKNAERDHSRAHFYHLLAGAFLGISLTATTLQLIRLIYAWSHQNHGPIVGKGSQEHLGHDPLTHGLIVTIGMGGVLAGLCHEYLEKRLFEKQARSYRWMASLYQTAIHRLDARHEAGDVKGAQTLIRELGREALAENADWVIYHREHEPKMKGHG